MISLLITALMSFAHAQGLNISPEYHGNYEGYCGSTTVTMSFDDKSLTLAHQMPVKSNLQGESVPGRVWSVQYMLPLLDSSAHGVNCIDVQTAPGDATLLATVCFSRHAATARPQMRILSAVESLMCRDTTVTRTERSLTSALRMLSHDAPSDTSLSARHFEFQVLHHLKPDFPMIAAITAVSTDDLEQKLNALKLAGRAFMKDPGDVFGRYTVIEIGLFDRDPAVRTEALNQIALTARIPMAVTPVLRQLTNPNNPPQVLRAALDATEGLLEDALPYVKDVERLRHRFATADPRRIHVENIGKVDSAYFAAINHVERADFTGLPWTEAQCLDMIDALVALVENDKIDIDVRRRAADVAAHAFAVKNSAGVIKTVASGIRTLLDDDKTRSKLAQLYMLYDYAPEYVRAQLAQLSSEPPISKKFRESLKNALGDVTTHALRMRCQAALAQVR